MFEGVYHISLLFDSELVLHLLIHSIWQSPELRITSCKVQRRNQTERSDRLEIEGCVFDVCRLE